MANYQHLRSSTAGKKPAPQQIKTGELAINLTDRKLFSKNELGQVFEFALGGSGSGGDGGGGGTPVITPFIGLPDTPLTYVGQGGRMLQVNQDETGLIFVDKPAGGGLGGGFDPTLYLGYGYPTVENPDPKKPSQTGAVKNLQEVVNHLFTYASSGKDALIDAFQSVGLPADKNTTFKQMARTIKGLKGYTFSITTGDKLPVNSVFDATFIRPKIKDNSQILSTVPSAKKIPTDLVTSGWDQSTQIPITDTVRITII